MPQPALLRSVSDLIARIRGETDTPSTPSPETPSAPSPETPATLPPETPPDIPGYVVRGRIGAGGMGAVYLAEEVSLGRPVAIKVIFGLAPGDHETRRLFLNEAKCMASVTHENVVHVYARGEHEGEPYIVMEYVKGESLATLLRRCGRLAEPRALDIVKQTVDALEAAWEEGIVHRDIKPANILLNEKDLVKVCDFGLAKPIAPDPSSAPTISGRPAGTPHYMAPEQASGQPTDLRSDVYSLGIVLYEMLVGRPPFSSKSPFELMTQHLHEPLPGLDDAGDIASKEVSDLYEWMTRKEPAERPQSYGALRERVEAVTSSAPTPIPTPRPWWKQLAYGAVAVGLLVVAVVVGPTLVGEPPEPALPGTVGVADPQFARLIAIADFENRTGHPELDYLSAALRSEIQTELIFGLRGFVVVSPHQLSNPHFSEADIGADVMLGGSFTQSGGRLQVSFSLLENGEGELPGSALVDAPEDEPLLLRARMVDAVVEMLRSKFGEVEFVAKAEQEPDELTYSAYLGGLGTLEVAETVEALDAAIDLLEEATRRDPDYARAHAALGRTFWAKYEMTGDESLIFQADRECSDAAGLDAELAAAAICSGWINAGRGRIPEAAADFQRAIELGDPVGAYRGLGFLSADLGDPALAEDYLRAAWQLNPGYPGAYMILGWFYAMEGQYEEAIEWYRSATWFAPGSAWAHLSLGAIYYLEGRYDEAILALEQSISNNATADAWSNLGLVYLALKDPTSAIDAFEQATGLADADYITTGNLARAYHHAGDRRAHETFEQAARMAEEAHNVNVEAWPATIMLAYYRVMLGEEETGLDYLDDALAAAPDEGEVHFWAAVIYLNLGETEGALTALEEVERLGYSPSETRDAIEFEALADEPRFRALFETH